ncbi:MAG: helix-turn-helix domain-containing protein [Oscillospiraceae bacterium]|nr:helix-turn-helix domain-containing protein [Oscillospiraceae bacterium]
MSLGERIQQTLDLKKISQTELARRLKIPLSTLNGYVQERYMPDCFKLKEIANALDVSADFLLEISSSEVLNEEEVALVVKYRGLSEEKKKVGLEYFRFLGG